MRSSCALTPSQKNLVSFDDAGRMAESASRSSGTDEEEDLASLSDGMNFMMRHIISATSSSPTDQVMVWVMKNASPSAVRLGPTTSVNSAATLTSSPGRR